MGDSQISLIPRFSDGVRKSRVRSRCFSTPFAKSITSIDRHLAMLIDTHIIGRNNNEERISGFFKEGAC
ncbi:hypothetical protein F2Q70_00016121 [Brassica cretica]|uniref:Uncharacterized protein n=1 Tax=Brassica cretica TaxID=69181 RepID=A0A8S9HYR9_BRACR|nr:hypothetical protein F2Q70_00016121 [Brassica cretica]